MCRAAAALRSTSGASWQSGQHPHHRQGEALQGFWSGIIRQRPLCSCGEGDAIRQAAQLCVGPHPLLLAPHPHGRTNTASPVPFFSVLVPSSGQSTNSCASMVSVIWDAACRDCFSGIQCCNDAHPIPCSCKTPPRHDRISLMWVKSHSSQFHSTDARAAHMQGWAYVQEGVAGLSAAAAACGD